MEDTRITRTSTAQYDMLLAISQDSINASIRAMWDVEGDNLEDIKHQVGILGKIDGKVSDVKVQVQADGAGRSGVLVRIDFASGTANFVDEELEHLPPCSMEGWKFCFRADIGLNNLHYAIETDKQLLADPNALDPKRTQEIKTRLEANELALGKFGERAGDYSIQRLFIDFTNANYNEFQAHHTVTPGLPKGAEMSFTNLMGRWLIKNKNEDKSCLGYGLSIEKRDVAQALKVADCLIPTQLVLNTYGYKATDTSDIPRGWSGDADRNCVVYCDMTEKREVKGERLLQWSGNFTSAAIADKERRIDGTMCLRRGLFLDRYILEMLQQYNDDMQIVPEYMNLFRDGPAGDRRYHWTFSAVLGYNKDHSDWKDAYFRLNENPKGAELSKIYSDPAWKDGHIKGFDAVPSTKGTSWSWYKSIEYKPDSINKDWKSPIEWEDHCSGSIDAWTHVDVIPVPGENKLKLRGISKITVQMDGYYTRLFKPDLDYKGKIIVAAFWQVDYAIIQGSDGLGCKVDRSDCFVRTDDSVFSQDFTKHAGGDAKPDVFMAKFKEEIPKMLKAKDAIAQAINDSLNATGKFTHPATGSFNLYDPVFNNNGDLLASVRYNAPSKKDKLTKVKMPEVGPEVQQPGPSDLSKAIPILGDITVPLLGKKGGEEKHGSPT